MEKKAQYTLLFVLLILLAGITSVSYFAGGAIALGIALSWGLPKLYHQFRILLQKIRPRYVIYFLVIALLIFSVALLAIMDIGITGTAGKRPINLLADCFVVIEPVVFQSGTFEIFETLVTHEGEYHSGTQVEDVSSYTLKSSKEMVSTQVGLFTKQVSAPATASSFLKSVRRTIPECQRRYTCTLTCVATTIELRNIPRGAFIEAQNSKDLEKHPYLNTEEITWTYSYGGDKLTFAYLRPPFYHARPILEPFLNIYALSTFIWGIIGFVSSSVFTQFWKRLGSALTRDKKEPTERVIQKAKLIISPSGEEKEVEVIDDE